MELHSDKQHHWTICTACHGLGKITTRVSRKRYRQYRIEVSNYESSDRKGSIPQPPTGNPDVCFHCAGSGLHRCESAVQADAAKYPTVAIIGGGIGGVALAVACLHRGIPFTLYERDESFNSRSQGYGLTLQQASNAIRGLGIFSLDAGITSTRHVVHNPSGKIIGEWGMRKWKTTVLETTTKRKNMHIARQTLRQLLFQQLGNCNSLRWGHSLTGLSSGQTGPIKLTFQVGGRTEMAHADLVVGADGIRSRVRELVIGDGKTPLQYLGCIVILGICPLRSLGDCSGSLLDSATVFQTVNGHDRIYMMPYDTDTIMWQLSFPLSESEAKTLSVEGAQAMKQEAYRRTQGWHDPIPNILAATADSNITGYPVYDRTVFDPRLLTGKGNVTLLGDAAHPMSPFKGQGANQALLDALMLARKISLVCDQNPMWRQLGIRTCVLNEYESEMVRRSATKVRDSAAAVQVLHSNAVLHEGDSPRGRGVYLP